MTVKHAQPIRPRSPALRTGLAILGGIIIILSPIVGAIPGPGGVFVFAAGLALILQNSKMAKRVFVQLKRKWPKFGSYADLGLRRASALRRFERDRPVDAEGKKIPATKLMLMTIRDFIRGRRV